MVPLNRSEPLCLPVEYWQACQSRGEENELSFCEEPLIYEISNNLTIVTNYQYIIIHTFPARGSGIAEPKLSRCGPERGSRSDDPL